MFANYHTHTARCGHASGTEREYVECAIKGGLKILGFSDHTPQPFKNGYYSNFRMRMEELENYVNTILSLKKEYEKDIEIHMGLEVEYYPDCFEELVKFASCYGIEYFILAQHFLGNEQGEQGVGSSNREPELLNRYCKQVIEALETNQFTYFAHPDMIRDIGDTENYLNQLRKVCQVAKEHQIPMEINLLGIRDHRHYPNEVFWKMVGEVGCQVIFGADAHKPEDVWRPHDVELATEIVNKYHLNLIDTVELRRPGL